MANRNSPVVRQADGRNVPETGRIRGNPGDPRVTPDIPEMAMAPDKNAAAFRGRRDRGERGRPAGNEPRAQRAAIDATGADGRRRTSEAADPGAGSRRRSGGER